jgi:nucleoside-diphosphate-sugar epimerase
MRILICGYGVIGDLVAQRLLAAGHTVVGIRRTPGPVSAGVQLLIGDAAQSSVHADLPPMDAVLLAANPGIRRGRDNGLLAMAQLIATRYATARVVYTGTTSLYGDAAGALVDEAGALAETPEASALRAIEVALDEHAQAVVLRATALVGPTRTFTRERLRAANGGEVLVKGDVERPFSFLHEADLADLCEHFLLGNDAARKSRGNEAAEKARGVLNAAAPQQLTVRAYYEHQAALAGVPARLRGDGSDVPRRGIDSGRLRRLLPDFSWRGLEPA